jgi:signal transduction histidine kinase
MIGELVEFAPSSPKTTGLGLSICRRIIEDHGGAQQARPEPNRGAIFRFRLPRRQP